MRAAVLVLLVAAPAAAGTYEATPADDLEQKIAALVPGDELIVRGGTYTISGRFTVSLVGTAAAPIVIRAADGERPVITGRVVIANNALYAQRGNAIAVAGELAQVIVAGNRGVGTLAGVSTGFTVGALATDVESGSYAGAPPMDLFPRAGSALIAGGDVTYVTTDDYNGRARNGVADVGAYAFAPGGNPGPPLAPGIKPPTGSSSDGDGGLDGGDVSMTQPGGCCQTGDAPGTGALAAMAGVLAVVLRRRRR